MTNENIFSNPVALSMQLMYASLSRRLGAFLIDCILLAILSVMAGAIIPVLGAILVWFFYAPILESSEIRGTIGKNLMGIQVTDIMGRRISLRSALIRNAMKIVSGAILCIGFIFALFNRQKQTLHDLLAETVVVYGRSEMPIAAAWLENCKDVFRAGKTKFDSPNEVPIAPETKNKASESVVDQLERLLALRNQKEITEEEYQAAKKKILQ